MTLRLVHLMPHRAIITILNQNIFSPGQSNPPYKSKEIISHSK